VVTDSSDAGDLCVSFRKSLNLSHTIISDQTRRALRDGGDGWIDVGLRGMVVRGGGGEGRGEGEERWGGKMRHRESIQ
jgi:hypothetical protein